MTQKKLKILVYLLTFIFLSSIVSTSSSTIHLQTTDDWTFLIYINGDNNLQNAVFDDISEMEEILKMTREELNKTKTEEHE